MSKLPKSNLAKELPMIPVEYEEEDITTASPLQKRKSDIVPLATVLPSSDTLKRNQASGITEHNRQTSKTDLAGYLQPFMGHQRTSSTGSAGKSGASVTSSTQPSPERPGYAITPTSSTASPMSMSVFSKLFSMPKSGALKTLMNLSSSPVRQIKARKGAGPTTSDIVMPAKDIFITKYQPFREVDVVESEMENTQESQHHKTTPSQLPQSQTAGFEVEQRIFELFVILRLDFMHFMDDTKPPAPTVLYKYPVGGEHPLMENIPLFCFPELGIDSSSSTDGGSKSASYRHIHETFNFTLTDVTQEKKYGYCKRITSEKNRDMQVLCMISPTKSFQFYDELLNFILPMRNDLNNLTKFMEQLAGKYLPKPGRSLEITVNRAKHDILRSIESASATEDQVLKLLVCLGILDLKSLTQTQMNLMKLVSLLNALLLEKRIVFCSRSLQKLSDCCNAAASLIYPLEWQHVFVPILPKRLLEFVCSPTPYIVGILSGDVEKMLSQDSEFSIENAFIYDLDMGKIIRNDVITKEDSILPPYLISVLKNVLEQYYADPSKSHISNVFLNLFILMFGHYRKHMEADVSGKSITVKKRMNSTELLTAADQVHVWYNFEESIKQHPILQTGNNAEPMYLANGNLLKPMNSQQLGPVKLFLQQFENLQNFQFFIQEREEALQFHYQQQLLAFQGKSTAIEQLIKDPNLKKNYYSLAQSKFERLLTEFELEKSND